MAGQITLDVVLGTLRTALDPLNPQRAAAEATLAGWESDAAPGFAQGLIRIVEEAAAVDEVGLPVPWVFRSDRQVQGSGHGASAAARGPGGGRGGGGRGRAWARAARAQARMPHCAPPHMPPARRIHCRRQRAAADVPLRRRAPAADAPAGGGRGEEHRGQQLAQDAGHARMEPRAAGGEGRRARGLHAAAAVRPQRQVRRAAVPCGGPCGPMQRAGLVPCSRCAAGTTGTTTAAAAASVAGC